MNSQVHVLVALCSKVEHHHLGVTGFEGAVRRGRQESACTGERRLLTPPEWRRRGLLLLLALDGSVDHEVGEVNVALRFFSLHRREKRNNRL